MAPVVMELRRQAWADVILLSTGQHRSLLDQTLAVFGLEVEHDLDVMRAGQSLSELTGRLFLAVGAFLDRDPPDMVIGQGDTTSAMVASVCAFYRHIPFAHVEAGLRTGDAASPFPEEFNRRAIALIAGLHFPPTKRALRNLSQEGVPSSAMILTGNTVIDAVQYVRKMFPPRAPSKHLQILLTMHRRENIGEPMRGVFRAIIKLVETFKNLEVIYPVHPNPAICGPAHDMLAGQDRVRLCEPLQYREFAGVLEGCHFVLTDSGGLQEEAAAFAKPTLVLREDTERPEAIEAGIAKLVGVDEVRVFSEASRLLTEKAAYAAMAVTSSAFGDGRAAERIVAAIGARLNDKGPERLAEGLRPQRLAALA